VAYQKQGSHYFGYYRFAFYDMTDTGWQKTGVATIYSRTWNKYLWRVGGLVVMSSQKYW
jgi:hypothetical protein